jgi:AcrR family transcriptional regulator
VLREWVPTPSSAKGRLALEALREFGRRGFDAVNVVDLAARAGVTTGALYHHFGSKLGLYSFVRDEVERRVLDRMEGAAALLESSSGNGALRALLVGFDYATERGFARLMSEQHPDRTVDPVETFLRSVLEGSNALAPILAAAWRAALAAAARGDAGAREAFVRLRVADAA